MGQDYTNYLNSQVLSEGKMTFLVMICAGLAYLLVFNILMFLLLTSASAFGWIK